jgi:pimeloyl-ACP methyl ester carboxylesterase
LLERWASHGFVVVRADPPASLMSSSHPAQTLDAQAVLDWALDAGGPVGPWVDPGRVAASGHSAGGKITTMLAFADERVGALLGLDPVNGSGPFGYTADQPDIVPEQVEPLAIPIGLLGETTDATAGLGGQACAPAAQNFQTFYDAATSSPWVAAWELVGADHIDFVFDSSTCGLACSLCRDGAADGNVVRETVQTLATAFLRRHLLGEPAQEAWLLGELLPAETLLQRRP